MIKEKLIEKLTEKKRNKPATSLFIIFNSQSNGERAQCHMEITRKRGAIS